MMKPSVIHLSEPWDADQALWISYWMPGSTFNHFCSIAEAEDLIAQLQVAVTEAKRIAAKAEKGGE